MVDISPHMTAIWRDKAVRLGLSPEIHNMPIEEFLSSDDRRWDLITFTSALHHLKITPTRCSSPPQASRLAAC